MNPDVVSPVFLEFLRAVWWISAVNPAVVSPASFLDFIYIYQPDFCSESCCSLSTLF